MRKKFFIILLLFIFLCSFSGFLFIRSDAFLNYLRKPLVNALQKQVAQEYSITVGKLSGDILTGVRVEKFAISERATQEPVISTSAIKLKYNLLGLLRRKFLVTALEIDSPEVYARWNRAGGDAKQGLIPPQAAGKINLTQVLRESSQESSDFEFAVADIAITDGAFYFTDTQRNFKIEIPGIKVELNGSLDAWAHTGNFSVDKGSFGFEGTEVPVEPFAGSFFLSAHGGELAELQFKSGNSALKLSGSWGQGTWDTEMRLTIDAADVQKIINSEHTLRGTAEITLEAKGNPDESLTGHITAQVPTVSINDILMEQLAVSAEFTAQGLTVKNATGKIADGEVSGKGRIAKATGAAEQRFTYSGTMSVKDVQLLSLLPMFVELPEGNPHLNSGALAGTAQVRGDTSGMLHLESSMQLSGAAFLVKRNSPAEQSGVNALNTEIALKDSFLNCTISAAAGHNAQVTADGSLDTAPLNIEGPLNNLQLALRDVDFGKLFQIFDSAPFAGTGSITAQITKEGTARGYVEVPATTFMDNPIGVLTGNFRYAEGRMFIENGHLTKGESRIEIAGTVDIEGELPANLQIVAAPLKMDSDYTKLLMGEAYPVEGTLTGELKLDGSLTHLDGRGTFAVNAGKAWGIRLDALTLPLEIDDYTITIANFEITARDQLVTLDLRQTANGDFDLGIKNSPDKPVQLAEIATAADIIDFPFDAQLDVSVVGHQKQPKDLDMHIELDFSELTFLGNPLGDVSLFGRLVERSKTKGISPASRDKYPSGEPDIFDFHGHGFEETSRIRGYISMATDNPYHFEMQSKAMDVTPILRILHPALEAITGTGDSLCEITGTLAELAPPAATGGTDSTSALVYTPQSGVNTLPSDEIFNAVKTTERSQRTRHGQKYPYDVDITILSTQLRYNTLHFTNAEPIRLQLVDDVWTFSAFSLMEENHPQTEPFIQLTGTFDAESEAMDIRAASTGFALDAFGTAFGLPPSSIEMSGTARYALTATGTIASPIVAGEWAVPTLAVKTEIGEIDLSSTNCAITYQDNTLNIEPFSLQLLGNPLQVEGDITVHPEDFNKSRLNLYLTAVELHLPLFADLIKNGIPDDTKKLLTVEGAPLIEGVLGVSAEVRGSIAKPIIAVNAHTPQHHPIRLGVFAKPITLEKLRAVTTIDGKFVDIREVEANGQIGDGDYKVRGEVSFSTPAETPQTEPYQEFDLDVSMAQLAVEDVAPLFLPANSNGAFPVHGTVSGTAKLTGTGFHPAMITATCKVNQLKLQVYNRTGAETELYLPLQSRGNIPSRPLNHNSESVFIPACRANTFATSYKAQVPVFHVTHNLPFRLQYDKGNLAGHLPLRITSAATETNINVNIAGTRTSPHITAKWQGTIKVLALQAGINTDDKKPPTRATTQSRLQNAGNTLGNVGDVQYRDKRINIVSIELSDNSNRLTLNGMIPFDLQFAAMDISERFLTEPLDVQLRGHELPLNFFPGLVQVFSKEKLQQKPPTRASSRYQQPQRTEYSARNDGVVDINLALQGTTRSPHLHGEVSVQAARLHLNTFDGLLTNVTLQLKAQQGLIDVAKLQFEMEGGKCTLEQAQLILDGLTPKRFELIGLKFKQYPLGSTVQKAGLLDGLEEIKGHVTATLNKLIIPLDSFFQSTETSALVYTPQSGANTLPSDESSNQLQTTAETTQTQPYEKLMQESIGEFSIDSLSFGFVALGRHYDFSTAQPILILLDSGKLRLEGFRLEALPPSTRNVEKSPLVYTPQSGANTLPSDESSNQFQTPAETPEVEPYEKRDVSIAGYGRWDMDGELLASLQLENFDVSVLNAVLPPEYRVKGTLSAGITITGSNAAPKVKVQWEGQGLGINQADIDTFTAELHYADRRWVISEDNPARLTLGANQLTASGTIPFYYTLRSTAVSPTELLEGNIRLEMKALEVLPLINPFLQSVSGTGTITATVGGTLAAPRLVGSGEFDEVAFEIPNAGVSLKDTAVLLNFSETGLNIERLEGKLNRGDFSVTGGIASDWLNVNNIALNAYLAGNTFVQPGQYQLNIDSANFHIDGHPTEPRLTGAVNIRAGHYEQDWENVRDWFAGTTVTEAEVALDTPLLRNIQLDIEMNLPSNFHLLSSLGGPTDIEIACFGRLVGPIQQPIFSGDVSILRGKISIFTQIFEFVEGSAISNQSTVDFHPALNISLQTPNPIRGVLLRDGNTADVIVRASITGTLNNTNLSFVPEMLNTTSTEVLTDADIIALLSPGSSISRAFGGITFTLFSGLEPDARHISAEYPLPFGDNMSIKMERDENGEYGVDFQWEQRF